MKNLNRREFAKYIASTYLGVNALMWNSELAGQTQRVAQARHVIFLNMSGGMTHIDTFDPKPENKEVMGQTTAINTSADGIQIGSWLPKTAEQMHLASLVRSRTSRLSASYKLSKKGHYCPPKYGKLGKQALRKDKPKSTR